MRLNVEHCNSISWLDFDRSRTTKQTLWNEQIFVSTEYRQQKINIFFPGDSQHTGSLKS